MNQQERNHRSNKLAVIVIAVVLAVAVFSVAANVIYQNTGFRKTYNEAVELAVKGDVKEAEELFQFIEERHYKDTDAFLIYCSAVKKAETGDYSFGYEKKDQMVFKDTTDDQNYFIQEQLDKIIQSYEGNTK